MKKLGRPARPMTEKEFQQLLQLVLTGALVERALRQIKRTWRTVALFLRGTPARQIQWDCAVTEGGRRRRGWPSESKMNKVLDTLVGNPGMSARTACAKQGLRGRSAYQSFIKMTQLPEWEDAYLRAKQVQRDRSLEELGANFEASEMTRDAIRTLNKTTHALKRLEPRRLYPGVKRRSQWAAYQRWKRTGLIDEHTNDGGDGDGDTE